MAVGARTSCQSGTRLLFVVTLIGEAELPMGSCSTAEWGMVFFTFITWLVARRPRRGDQCPRGIGSLQSG